MFRNKKVKIIFMALTMVSLIATLTLTAFAKSGDVAGAVESTWNVAKGQIKQVVNNVVFPVIDLVLAVCFFVFLIRHVPLFMVGIQDNVNTLIIGVIYHFLNTGNPDIMDFIFRCRTAMSAPAYRNTDYIEARCNYGINHGFLGFWISPGCLGHNTDTAGRI